MTTLAHFLLLIALCTSSVLALPAPFLGQSFGRAGVIRLPGYYSPDRKVIWDATTTSSLTGSNLRGGPDIATNVVMTMAQMEALALAHLRDNLSMGPGVDLVSVSSHVGASMCYSYIRESVNGIPIVNSAASASVSFDGQVYSRTSSWVAVKADDSSRLAKRSVSPDKISAKDALLSVARKLRLAFDARSISESSSPASPGEIIITGAAFTTSDVSATEKLYATPGGLHSVWDLSIPMATAWLNCFVDDISGEILGSSNWMSSLDIVTEPSSELDKRQDGAPPTTSYLIVPLGGRDIRTSVGTQLVQSISDPRGSPLGWHNARDGRGSMATTMGNNVIAQENRRNKPNFMSGLRPALKDFSFQFSVNDRLQEPQEYADASIVNTFVMANIYHDILYNYGFTEAAGNFQVDNLGRGGKGGDPVIANIQDGSSVNNANFVTPPDGQAGIMRMFVFTSATPNRDGALENSVALHELTHGLSNRLTGGPANINCLSTTEALGLGEGWSDAVALILEVLPTDTRDSDRAVGAYVTNNPVRGIRRFPYSTNMQRNPHTYGDLRGTSDRHIIGEVWATILFEIYWNLVDSRGFAPNLKDSARSGKGNSLFLQIIVDGMKLQPCNPSFIQARNAIVRADAVANGGANFCEIVRGFSKRGLGEGAMDNGRYANNFVVPARC